MNRKIIEIILFCLALLPAVSRAETYDFMNDRVLYAVDSQLTDAVNDINAERNAANVANSPSYVTYGYIATILRVIYVPKSVQSVSAGAYNSTNNTVLIFEDATDLEIGSNAFAGRSVEDIYFMKGETRSISKSTRPKYTSQTITLGREVTKINNFETNTRYNVYPSNPPQLSDEIINNFSKYEGKTIHITKEATLAYFSDPYWSRFTLINDLVLHDKITLSPDSKTLKIGENFTMSINKTYAPDADYENLYTKPSVLWTTDNQTLKYQDLKAKAMIPGEVDIVAFNIDRFDTCHVIVEQPELSIDIEEIRLDVGESATVTATVTPTSAASGLEYSIDDPFIASNDNGVITALAPGETDLIVKCYDQIKRCHIIVNELPPNVISITEEHLTLNPTDAATLTATSTRAVSKFIITNTDNNIAVATRILQYSDHIQIRVTALRPGKTTVTVTTSDNDVVPAQCVVTVLGALDGDVNSDGTINVSDVSAIYNVILGISEDNGRSDINGDNNVNIGDVSVLNSIIINGQ